jgi:hypothetical protein
MRYIVQAGSVRFIYSSWDSLSDELQKIFRFLIHFGSIELVRHGAVYRLER